MEEVRLETADLAVIGVYMLAVLVVGFRAARRQSGEVEDYLLAGRRLTIPMFVATLVSSWYGGILGVGEYSYTYGLSQWTVLGVPYYVFGLVFALFLAERVRHAANISIPDRLRQAYGPAAGYLGAAYTFFMVNPAPYMLMVAVLLQLIIGGSLVVALLIAMFLSTVYLVAGGFRSVTATNYLDFVMMYLGFACILPFAYLEFGGLEFLESRLPELHLTFHGGSSTQTIIVWFFIALWTLVDPGFHQRCEAAANGRVARVGILVSIAFWFLFDALTVTTGLYARAVLPDLTHPTLAYPALATVVLPPVVRGLFFAGMLATIMSTLVSFSFLAGQTLGRDLFWRLRQGNVVRATRVGLVVAIVIGAGLVLLIPSVVELWYAIGSVFVPGMLLPLVSSYFTERRPSTLAATTMMVCGAGLSALWLLYGHWTGGASGPAYPLGLEPLYPGLAATVLVWLGDRFIARHGEQSSG